MLFSANSCIDERATSIPFGRSRQDVNRKCSEQHPKQALTRENRIAKRNLAPAREYTGERDALSRQCLGFGKALFRFLLLWRV